MPPLFRILTIGDPHFKSDNGESTEELTAKIVNLIEERLDSLDAVAVLGDILHRHEKIDLHPLYRATKFLESIHCTLRKSPNIKYLYIIIGNHDRSTNKDFMTDEHGFNPMKKWEDTFVVDQAMIHAPYEDFKVLLMPYVPPGRFQEGYLSVISEANLDKDIGLVLAHQEFQGAKMNTITSNEGDPWDSLKPLCVSGHIHDYQVVKHNMIYTGTPIQHGFADTGKKTVSVYTFTGNKEFSEERIDLKIKGRVTVRGTPENFSSLDLPIDEFYVKVKISGTKRSIKVFMESKSYKESLDLGVVFQFLELPTVEVTVGSEILGVDRDMGSFGSSAGVNFSCRLKKMLEDSSPEVSKVFREIFETS
jgi:DNA repair exonuclease SbcCD nuclease subunit